LDDLNTIAVFDRFKALRNACDFEAYLHFNENIAVALANPKLAIAFHERDRLRIIPYPVAGLFTGLKVQNGHIGRAASLQGHLYNRTDGVRAANVLSYGFSGTSEVCGGVVLTTNEESLKRILRLITSQQVQKLLE
jgi:hypothetical protein